MLNKSRRIIFSTLTLVSASFFMMACSGGGGSSFSTTSTTSTNNPGTTPPYVMSGQLDPSFGTNGQNSVPSGTDVAAVDVNSQSKGQVLFLYSSINVIAQDFSVSRYNADGTLDATFASSGTLNLSCTNIFGIEGCFANRVLVQNDDSIIVVSTNLVFPASIAVAATRYTSNGVLDTSYGTNGTSVSITGSLSAAFIDPNSDALVVAGSSTTGAYVARLTAAGALDTTFATTGKLSLSSIPGLTGTPTLNAVAYNSFSQEYVGTATIGADTAAGELTSSGSIDSTFGSSGATAFTGINSITALAVQSNGSILLGTTNSTSSLEVIRLLSDGQVDTSFGTSGTATIAPSDTTQISAKGLFVDGAGNIIVVSNSQVTVPPSTTAANSPFVARLTSSGSLDSTFASSGILSLSTAVNTINGAQLLANGKLVLATQTAAGGNLTQIE